jgi:hypothetical protein
MNKKHFLNLSQKYDQTGDYKKADQLFRQAQFYKAFVPNVKPIQMEGSDPFINASSSPEALQGTLGYTAAGNSAMPGGFISDVKSEDVPFVFKGLTPAQIQNLYDSGQMAAYVTQKKNEFQGVMRGLGNQPQQVEKDVLRSIFTSSQTTNDPKVLKLLRMKLPAIEGFIKQQINQKLVEPTVIKNEYIRLINSIPEYNNHPEAKQELINRINNL